MSHQLPLFETDETAPGHMTVEQARAIFGDLIAAVHAAFNEDETVTHAALFQARAVIESWYMREGCENDARYCAENGVR